MISCEKCGKFQIYCECSPTLGLVKWPKPKINNRGTTLLECLAVMAIIGILAMVGCSLTTWLNQNVGKELSANKQLSATIAQAQTLQTSLNAAIAGSCSVTCLVPKSSPTPTPTPSYTPCPPPAGHSLNDGCHGGSDGMQHHTGDGCTNHN